MRLRFNRSLTTIEPKNDVYGRTKTVGADVPTASDPLHADLEDRSKVEKPVKFGIGFFVVIVEISALGAGLIALI